MVDMKALFHRGKRDATPAPATRRSSLDSLLTFKPRLTSSRSSYSLRRSGTVLSSDSFHEGIIPLIVPDAAFGETGTELHLDRQRLQDPYPHDLALEPLRPFFIPLANLQMEISAGDARGGYGVVHVAKLLSGHGSSPQKVAVKELTSDLARTIPLRMAFRIAREMTVWCKLSHPNILPFTGYHLSVDMNIAYLVCPFIDEGNIRSYLLKYNPDRNERARFVQDTVDGLAYLHAIDVCHGDLKSLNVLVTNEKRAMLCDFGLASLTHDQPTGLTTSTGFKGSFRWCSPELLNNFPRDFLSDIWAWACVALEIVTGDFPYNDIVHDVAVVNWITKKSTPASATKSCQMLPKGMLGLWELCWSFNLQLRPDAAACAKAWSVCWDKERWHSSFLDSGSGRSATTADIPSSHSVRPAGNPQLQPSAAHARTWPGESVTDSGYSSQFNILNPRVSMSRPEAPRVTSGPAPQSAPSSAEARGSPFGDVTSVRRVRSLAREAPTIRVSRSADGDGLRARNMPSEASRGSSHATMRELSRLIKMAAELDDRVMWTEVCERGSTPHGARDLGGNIQSWLKYGAEPIRLIAVRTWILALRADHQPFLSLTSGKRFLRILLSYYDSPHTPTSVKTRISSAIAGAAWEFGKPYPDFRLYWAKIKGEGQPLEGIPYDTHDPFFSLPPLPRPQLSLPHSSDHRWSTLAVADQSDTASPLPPISPAESYRGGINVSPLSATGPPTPPDRPTTPIGGGGGIGGRLFLGEDLVRPYIPLRSNDSSRPGVGAIKPVTQIGGSDQVTPSDPLYPSIIITR